MIWTSFTFQLSAWKKHLNDFSFLCSSFSWVSDNTKQKNCLQNKYIVLIINEQNIKHSNLKDLLKGNLQFFVLCCSPSVRCYSGFEHTPSGMSDTLFCHAVCHVASIRPPTACRASSVAESLLVEVDVIHPMFFLIVYHQQMERSRPAAIWFLVLYVSGTPQGTRMASTIICILQIGCKWAGTSTQHSVHVGRQWFHLFECIMSVSVTCQVNNTLRSSWLIIHDKSFLCIIFPSQHMLACTIKTKHITK